MASVPTGTTFWIATAFGPLKPTTVVSNAAEATITAAAHDLAVNDIVELKSDWGRVNGRAFRVKTVPTVNTAVLEDCDTTNTAFFPENGGLGSVRKVTTFVQITKVLGATSSGGDPINVEYKYMENDAKFSQNDGFGASSTTIDIDADALKTPGYLALKNLTAVQTDTILRIRSRNGSLELQPGTVALNENVQRADGSINKVKASINGTNTQTRYAAAA